MINVSQYIQQYALLFPDLQQELPWDITQASQLIIAKRIKTLNGDFVIRDNIAIHKTAKIDEHVVLKGPVIISAGCVIAAHTHVRDGVYLGDNASVGTGCEIKSSFMFSNSSLAYGNFVGDSFIGSRVSLEPGAIIVNRYNDRKESIISVIVDGNPITIEVDTFGALIGDDAKIGANAVLSPGTILVVKSIVKRLELVEQVGVNR